MFLIQNNQAKMGQIWKCPFCGKTKSIFSGSIFQDSKLSVSDMLKIIYCWSYDFSVKTTSFETKTSCHSISAVFNQIKNACYLEIENSFRRKIGGVNLTVEIDETMLTKRKYHRGRMLNEQWVFGGICREDNQIFLELIPNRNSDTLSTCISKNIQYGSTIISDSWKGYSFLDDKNLPQPYLHQSVNHSKNFVDPKTGANTQKEERLWREFKEKKRDRKEFQEKMLIFIYQSFGGKEIKRFKGKIFSFLLVLYYLKPNFEILNKPFYQ